MAEGKCRYLFELDSDEEDIMMKVAFGSLSKHFQPHQHCHRQAYHCRKRDLHWQLERALDDSDEESVRALLDTSVYDVPKPKKKVTVPPAPKKSSRTMIPIVPVQKVPVRPSVQNIAKASSSRGSATVTSTSVRSKSPKPLKKISQKAETATSNDIQGPTCPICLENLNGSRPCSVTRCGHLFCTDCIEQSLRMSRDCPTCRESIRHKVTPVFL